MAVSDVVAALLRGRAVQAHMRLPTSRLLAAFPAASWLHTTPCRLMVTRVLPCPSPTSRCFVVCTTRITMCWEWGGAPPGLGLGLGLGEPVSTAAPASTTDADPDAHLLSDAGHGATPESGGGSVEGSVAGAGAAVAALRELVLWPLQHGAGLARTCPLALTHGVLLHGPPGVGKTAITRAIVEEAASTCNVLLRAVDGPSIMTSAVGGSEAKLRHLFSEATTFAYGAPGSVREGCEDGRDGRPRLAVIFLDEVDVLCRSREGALPRSGVQARVIAQLVTLMDDVVTHAAKGWARGHLVVIAATNHPHDVDAALRRPGRLDREVRMDPPDAPGRLAILQLYTAGLALEAAEGSTLAPGPPSFLHSLAQRCVGYVGADLAALCREAALAALPGPVTATHFLDAFAAMGVPSMLRGITASVPHCSWDSIGGLEDVKAKLKQVVEWPLRFPEAFRRMHLSAPGGVLLHGPPGCAKTTLVRAAATASRAAFFSLSGADVYSPYVGDAEKAVRAVFQRARASAPAIVFLDEVDAMVGSRGIGGGAGGGGEGISTSVLATLLNEMDGVEWSAGVLVVGATNRVDMLDPALLRPGRFEVQLHVPLPTPHERCLILQVHCSRMPLAPDLDLALVADRTEGCSGADLESICREAALVALREDVSSSTVTSRHFLAVLDARGE